MILTVHNLAKEYAVLPSQALDTATTFDLYVLDIATKWQIHQQNKEQGKPVETKDFSQETLKSMIDRVRNQSKERASGF